MASVIDENENPYDGEMMPPPQRPLFFSDLWEAATWNDVAAVRSFLDKGVAVDAKDSLGDTALIRAAIWGGLEVARLLVERGADVEARGYISRTALMCAASNGCTEFAQYLLNLGADTTAIDGYSETAATRARKFNHSEIVRMIETEEQSRAARVQETVSRQQRQIRERARQHKIKLV